MKRNDGTKYAARQSRPELQVGATDDLKIRVEKPGFTVPRIETKDGCYGVHATRRNGNRLKMPLHPITATVVEEADRAGFRT